MVLIRAGAGVVFVMGILAGCQSTLLQDAPAVVAVSAPDSRESTRPVAPPPSHDYSVTRLPIVSKLLAQARELMQSQQWSSSQHKIEQAIRVAPQDPDIYLNYGDWYLLQGDKLAAKEMFQRARALSAAGTREASLAGKKLEELSWH